MLYQRHCSKCVQVCLGFNWKQGCLGVWASQAWLGDSAVEQIKIGTEGGVLLCFAFSYILVFRRLQQWAGVANHQPSGFNHDYWIFWLTLAMTAMFKQGDMFLQTPDICFSSSKGRVAVSYKVDEVSSWIQSPSSHTEMFHFPSQTPLTGRQSPTSSPLIILLPFWSTKIFLF